MWRAVLQVMCFTGLQSTLQGGLRIFWILSETICAQVCWPHKVGAQHRRRSAECPTCDMPGTPCACGFRLVCRALETLCSARPATFCTFTIGCYLWLFIWGSKSFPERTALILASVCLCVKAQGSLLDRELPSRPVDAASLCCTRESSPQAEPRPPGHQLAIQPMRLT